MSAFRILLASILISILGYTAIVAWNHGFGLLPVFFGDIAEMGWPGQFNVDFMSLLALSGLWLAWRHHFSPAGIVVGLCGFFGGGLFLSGYLLYASYESKGDARILMLGRSRTDPLGHSIPGCGSRR